MHKLIPPFLHHESMAISCTDPAVHLNFRNIYTYLANMVEEGKEALTKLQDVVSELFEEVSQKEHRDSTDGLEARQAGELRATDLFHSICHAKVGLSSC